MVTIQVLLPYLIVLVTVKNGTLLNLALTGAASNWETSTALSTDIIPPSGYSITANQTLIDGSNETNLGFTFAGAEVGATYTYEYRDTADVVVANTGTIATATDAISAIDVSSLNDGPITLTVTLKDALGNTGAKVTQMLTKDTAGPTISILSTVSGVTNTSPIPVTVAFSEIVKGFALGDLTVGNGTAGNLTTTDSMTFTADITPAADGMVTLDIAANVVTDTIGNPNTDPAAQFSIEYNTSAPTVSISTEVDSVLTQNTFGITITFSEAVSGFEAGDVKVTGGAAGNLVTTDSTVFTTEITVSEEGAIKVEVPAGVATSLAGNSNIAATPLVRINEGVPPSVTVTTDADSLTNLNPIPFTITFSEMVMGFATEDISVANGTVASLTTPDSIMFMADIIPTADGAVSVSIAENVAQDTVGNGNLAAEAVMVTFDGTAPTVTISFYRERYHTNQPVCCDLHFQ